MSHVRPLISPCQYSALCCRKSCPSLSFCQASHAKPPENELKTRRGMLNLSFSYLSVCLGSPCDGKKSRGKKAVFKLLTLSLPIADGYTYEEDAIQEWLSNGKKVCQVPPSFSRKANEMGIILIPVKNSVTELTMGHLPQNLHPLQTSPMTNEPLQHLSLTPNYVIKVSSRL